jgi:hypothetical protein
VLVSFDRAVIPVKHYRRYSLSNSAFHFIFRNRLPDRAHPAIYRAIISCDRFVKP